MCSHFAYHFKMEHVYLYRGIIFSAGAQMVSFRCTYCSWKHCVILCTSTMLSFTDGWTRCSPVFYLRWSADHNNQAQCRQLNIRPWIPWGTYVSPIPSFSCHVWYDTYHVETQQHRNRGAFHVSGYMLDSTDVWGELVDRNCDKTKAWQLFIKNTWYVGLVAHTMHHPKKAQTSSVI